MQAILIYLLKATVCSGVFFLYYCIALRNKRFHYYNRFYLLMSVVLSLMMPLLNIELWQFNGNNHQVIQLMNVVTIDTAEVNATHGSYSLSWSAFLLLLYIVITLALVFTFVIGIYKLYFYRRMYPVERLGTILFINTDLGQAPFSFFNNLFWKNSIDINDATGRQIFKHELTHIEQKHSWDKLFLRITTLVFWMNPFYWLIQKELSIIHEFIADEKAIENKSAEAFALMLLQSQYSKNIFSPAQSFNYSPIKRRLLMLTNYSKTSYSYVRRVMVLPLLAATILLFAFKLKEKNQAPFHTNAPFTLIVDAGHGGTDAGIVGVNNIKEKDINLSIANKLQELAPQYGITVKMTRTKDNLIDLKERINMAEAAHSNAFVSIHMNGTTEDRTNKNEVNVYIPGKETNSNYLQSRLLGSSLLESAKKDFPINSSLLQQKEQGVYVLDHNPSPAVIIECGYLNNPDNVKQLQDADKTEQLARDILAGVVAFANAAPQTASTVAEDTIKKTPLYIVNGKEISDADAKKIAPEAIESINVLKGDEGIKKYGEKGKNGVVIITLKNNQSMPLGSASQSMLVQDSNAVNAAKKTLKVVDGKIVTNAELDKLNPNDFESMTVLKGESAINKYGEKGSNGVIEITTKKNTNANSNVQSFTPPKIVRDSVVYPTNDSAVDFTGNTSLHKIVEVKSKDINGKQKEPEKVFNATQIAPKFPDGPDAWQKYLQKNMHSDVPTMHQAPTGTYTVIVSFTVDTEGNVYDVKADNDPGFGTGAEAVRVIKEGPKWIPAVQNGRAVTTKTKQAITFRVEEG